MYKNAVNTLSVYFVVKTALRADAKRKCRTAKKTCVEKQYPLIRTVYQPDNLSLSNNKDPIFRILRQNFPIL